MLKLVWSTEHLPIIFQACDCLERNLLAPYCNNSNRKLSHKKRYSQTTEKENHTLDFVGLCCLLWCFPADVETEQMFNATRLPLTHYWIFSLSTLHLKAKMYCSRVITGVNVLAVVRNWSFQNIKVFWMRERHNRKFHCPRHSWTITTRMFCKKI